MLDQSAGFAVNQIECNQCVSNREAIDNTVAAAPYCSHI